MHSTLHGTIKIAGSPADIFHFNLPAEQSEEKLNAQNSRLCSAVTFAQLSEERNKLSSEQF